MTDPPDNDIAIWISIVNSRVLMRLVVVVNDNIHAQQHGAILIASLILSVVSKLTIS